MDSDMEPDTELCLDLCDAIGGEILVGTENHAILPGGRLMAKTVVAAAHHGLTADGLSIVKLMETARRHLDDLGYNTATAEMSVHLDTHPCLRAATMTITIDPKEQDNG